tara:strand:+ start:2190 stop:2360 length:171 start_codon:yes stop_codon:yes gene_type:complete
MMKIVYGHIVFVCSAFVGERCEKEFRESSWFKSWSARVSMDSLLGPHDMDLEFDGD